MISNNKLTFGLFKDSQKQALKFKDAEKLSLINKLNLNEIIQVDFPENQYMKEQTNKTQIVIHHTVSGQGVDGDISWWRETADRIGTALIIGWDGKIYQCFSSQYWAHHLGLKTSNNLALNKTTIGIEIDAWGGLIKLKNQWYPALYVDSLKNYIANTKVKPIPAENVQEYPKGFMGFNAYEKYTPAQIESVRKLLVYFNEKYKIPLDYNEKMWDINTEALTGKPGIWTHVSYRGNGKSDCHPDPQLIEMLKSLK
jgi:N-acetyl-anhydromuramyl-L-alanine amidase AmpD